MKILLCSIGSRGDIEPFLALAELFRKQEWDVTCAFPEQFREMTEREGFKFHGFSKDFIDVLIRSAEGHSISGGEGNIVQRTRNIWILIRKSIRINQEIISDQRNLIIDNQFDYIFYHPKCLYPTIWGLKYPERCITVSPLPCILHPTKEHSVIGLRGGGDYGPIINQLSYTVSNWVRAIAFYFSTKKYHDDILNIWVTPRKIKRSLLNVQKTFYTISPTLFPKPAYWPDHVCVTGYLERNKVKHWRPSEGLLHFFSRYSKILFISFGSISNPHPEEKTAAILQVIEKHNIPTIISTAWGGLVKANVYPSHVYFVNRIPYDWLFPKVYGVVHHGGSGTTHTALKYGCASLIIPHFIDQFYWNDRVFDLGAGPKGVSIKKLNAHNFETCCLDLWNNKLYKQNANDIGLKLQKEAEELNILDFISKN